VGAGNAASFGVVFQVGAGLQVTGANVAYVGEQWFRAGATSNDRLDFQYKILTSYNPATFRIHTETGWTDVDALDFPRCRRGSNSKLDGNAGANRAALSSTDLTHATAGQFIAFRWTNVSDVTAAQAALAVDDLTIDFTATPVAGPDSPNFIVIVTDDQRWDATSFMQSRMASLGRTARFPYLLNPSPRRRTWIGSRPKGFTSTTVSVFTRCVPPRAR
jgi:hypothetical protein